MTNYDYMPETFATREEQRNNFVFDEEKEKYEKKEVWIKVALPHTFCVLKFLTLSNNNWTSSSDQIKLISGD